MLLALTIPVCGAKKEILGKVESVLTNVVRRVNLTANLTKLQPGRLGG